MTAQIFKASALYMLKEAAYIVSGTTVSNLCLKF